MKLDAKLTIITVILFILTVATLVVGIPMENQAIANKKTELKSANDALEAYEMKKEIYDTKSQVLNEITKNKESLQDEIFTKRETGEIKESYMDTTNTNIFLLFSKMAEMIDIPVANLKIYEHIDEVPLSNEEIAQMEENKKEEAETEEEKETTEETENAEGEQAEEEKTAVNLHKEVKTDVVKVSLYGNYSDLQVYFELLNQMSGNFSLKDLEVYTVVLENGNILETYTKEENENSFIVGETTETVGNTGIYTYETLVEENKNAISDFQEIQKEKSQEYEDRYTSITNQYGISDYEAFEIARYYSQKYKIPTQMLLAFMDLESGFEATAVNENTNGTIDRGLMQINSKTAPDLLSIVGVPNVPGIIHIPALNVDLGTMHLKSVADSWGIDLESATEAQLHAVFTSYNRGVQGAKDYARDNKDFETTPFESIYSEAIFQRIEKYKEFPNEDPILIQDYTNDVLEYRELVSELNETIQKENSIEEIAKEYEEQTMVKAIFEIKSRERDSLLLEEYEFKYEEAKNKPNPLKDNTLSKNEQEYLGDNGIGNKDIDLSNKVVLEEELNRTKKVLRNRLLANEPIERQIAYLKELVLYNIVGE